MASDLEASPPTLPSSIGICLSGGGYRAAAFHLGALAYLDHVGLASSKLKAISTVSGGTFTGVRYALSRVASASFAEFFRDFYRDLIRFDLVELGLARLGTKPNPQTREQPDLIVAVAHVYAETFFRSGDGSTHLFGEILDADIDIEEIAFNATEFRHGIAFRFQKSAQGRIGNGLISITKEDAAKIRLADIVAASSCFPGGFEPLAFPDDFVWPGGTIPEEVERSVAKRGEGPIALMDGGIYDNQGIESLLLADERRDTDLDMFIISDVDQPSDDMYPFPEKETATGMTVGALNLAARALMIACAVTAVIQGAGALDALRAGSFTFWDFFRYIIPTTLAGLTAYVLWWTRRTIRKEMGRIPSVGRAAWEDLRKLRLGQLAGMVRLRITSLFAMASTIFMGRVRALVYGRIYRDERYQHRRVSNLIYDLLPSRQFFFEDRPDILKPSSALGRVVTVAVEMPTTLWFEKDKPYQLPCLVAAGQATLCYNLMKIVTRRFGSDPKSYQDDVADFWNKLVTDWSAMVADPYALLEPLWSEARPRPPKPAEPPKPPKDDA